MTIAHDILTASADGTAALRTIVEELGPDRVQSVRTACAIARCVLHLSGRYEILAQAAIEAAEAWIADPTAAKAAAAAAAAEETRYAIQAVDRATLRVVRPPAAAVAARNAAMAASDAALAASRDESAYQGSAERRTWYANWGAANAGGGAFRAAIRAERAAKEE